MKYLQELPSPLFNKKTFYKPRSTNLDKFESDEDFEEDED